jgi:A/G-specific adenine glycosylase
MPPADTLSAPLVAWYRDHRRPLPWRTSPTPYRVLLSELMCQQTRVDTVLPYFARFVARWPTIEALAAAPDDEVLKEWAGLGYYSRARNLLAAARSAVARGGLPSDPVELAELPGIGPYTAGAIASIAFGVAAPAVDGNVERVLSRVHGLDADPKAPAGRRALVAHATALLAGFSPSDVNQGLMELGATVCTPRNPACDACPWGAVCASRGDPERRPTKAARKPPVPIRAVAGLWTVDGATLMGRRPPGLLGGLWEPVSVPLDGDCDPREALRDGFRDRAGVEARVGRRLGGVVHVFSHRRLALEVYAVNARGTPEKRGWYEDLRWVRGTEGDIALSTLTRKTLALGDAAPDLAWFAADADDP